MKPVGIYFDVGSARWLWLRSELTVLRLCLPSARITSINHYSQLDLILTKVADIPHRVNGGMLLIKYDKQRRCGDAASQGSAVQSLSVKQHVSEE